MKFDSKRLVLFSTKRTSSNFHFFSQPKTVVKTDILSNIDESGYFFPITGMLCSDLAAHNYVCHFKLLRNLLKSFDCIGLGGKDTDSETGAAT